MNNEVRARATQIGMSLKEYLTRLHSDSVFFAQEVWHAADLNRYGRLRRYEKRMIRWACEGPSKRGALGPRGIGKTYFCGLVCAAWNLFRDGECKILFISKSRKHAKKSLKQLKGWIDRVPFLRHLKADTYAHKRMGFSWTEEAIDVATCEPGNRTPSVYAMGVESQLPGSRAYIVIADDIETDETCKTAEGQENVWGKAKELINISTYGKQEVVYLGTFFPDDSIYSRLDNLRFQGGPNNGEKVYHFKTWPVIAPTPTEAAKMIRPDEQLMHEIKVGILDPGDKLFPHRSDHGSDLFLATQRSHGMTHWYRQYMLIPGVMDSLRYPLKLKDLIVFDIPRDQAPIGIAWGTRNHDNVSTRIQDIPHFVSEAAFHKPIYYDKTWSPFERVAMWIDVAGEGADHTAYSIIGVLNGMYWLKEICEFPAGRGYAPEVLTTIAEKARWHRVNTIFIEKQFGAGMMNPLLMPYLQKQFLKPGDKPDYPHGWACDIQCPPAVGQKEIRICDALEGVVQSHRLVIDRAVAEHESFQNQFARITREKNSLKKYHDDVIEAVAMCVLQLKDSAGEDPEDRMRRHLEEIERRQWELEEEDWLGGGAKQPEPNWIQRV